MGLGSLVQTLSHSQDEHNIRAMLHKAKDDRRARSAKSSRYSPARVAAGIPARGKTYKDSGYPGSVRRRLHREGEFTFRLAA
jgi:hypothetical protein